MLALGWRVERAQEYVIMLVNTTRTCHATRQTQREGLDDRELIHGLHSPCGAVGWSEDVVHCRFLMSSSVAEPESRPWLLHHYKYFSRLRQEGSKNDSLN